MDCRPPGSSVHGILQARVLEWVAISFSRGSSWPRDQTRVSWTSGRFFTIWDTREAHRSHIYILCLHIQKYILNTQYTQRKVDGCTLMHTYIYTHVVLCLVAQSCPTVGSPMDCSLSDSSVHGDSPGKNTRVGYHALLQGIFPTQGSNPGLMHCRWILYHLSHQGSKRTLEWVAYPCSRGSSWPRNWTRVSCITSGVFTSWATREAHIYTYV